MASSNLDELLQEALADFDEPQQAIASTTATQQHIVVPGPATAASAETSADVQDASEPPATAAPAKPAPKGLGLGLGLGGSDLPGRRSRKPAGGSAATIASRPDNEEDNKGDGGCGEVAPGRAKPTRKLPADAQRLADDLMSLLHEAGLGERSEPQDANALTASLADLMAMCGNAPAAGGAGGGIDGGFLQTGLSSDQAGLPARTSGSPGPGVGLGEDDPFAQLFGRILGGLVPPGGPAGGDEAAPPPELATMLQQMLGASGPSGLAGVRPPGPAAGPSGAPGAGPSAGSAAAAAASDEDDALASSRLAGLAQQTLKTVSQQAKKTRGHVEGGALGRADAAGPGCSGGGGGLPFGSAATGRGGGLASMLRELGGLGLPGGSGEAEDAAPSGVSMMVDYIMQHLLSKDVLYGPLKEIRDRYPPWLEAHQGALPAEDYRRFVAQYESVQRVCAHYETSPSDFAKLMDLIQEMQTYGDPPGDIVEEMTGGAGRDINSILAAAEGEEKGGPSGTQPALEELSNEHDKCKVQ